MNPSRVAVVFLVLLAASSGCGGGTSSPGMRGALTCSSDARAMLYQPGMSQTTSEGHLMVTLLSSLPGPPLKGNNTWVVEVRDPNGPIDGATLSATPFMPDHGHGSSIRVGVEAAGAPGTYRLARPRSPRGRLARDFPNGLVPTSYGYLAPVNLFMSGLWRVTVNVATPAGQHEFVTFLFCVEG